MARGSEQISTKWVAGLERRCRDCGIPITNLSKQVGEIRYSPEPWIRCMDCFVQRPEDRRKKEA